LSPNPVDDVFVVILLSFIFFFLVFVVAQHFNVAIVALFFLVLPLAGDFASLLRLLVI
jgi:hypothetical protein